jgi:hypothetical protein
MYFDAGLIGEVDEGSGLVADRVLDHAAHFLHLDPADPAGEVRRHVLLENPVAFDAVGIACHRDRPVAQPRQHPPGDIRVVPGQILLGDAVVGKQDLPGVGELNRRPVSDNLFGHAELLVKGARAAASAEA